MIQNLTKVSKVIFSKIVVKCIKSEIKLAKIMEKKKKKKKCHKLDLFNYRDISSKRCGPINDSLEYANFDKVYGNISYRAEKTTKGMIYKGNLKNQGHSLNSKTARMKSNSSNVPFYSKPTRMTNFEKRDF